MKKCCIVPRHKADSEDYGTDMDTTATAIADFRQGKSSLFEASNGWTNGKWLTADGIMKCSNKGWSTQPYN